MNRIYNNIPSLLKNLLTNLIISIIISGHDDLFPILRKSKPNFGRSYYIIPRIIKIRSRLHFRKFKWFRRRFSINGGCWCIKIRGNVILITTSQIIQTIQDHQHGTSLLGTFQCFKIEIVIFYYGCVVVFVQSVELKWYGFPIDHFQSLSYLLLLL